MPTEPENRPEDHGVNPDAAASGEPASPDVSGPGAEPASPMPWSRRFTSPYASDGPTGEPEAEPAPEFAEAPEGQTWEGQPAYPGYADNAPYQDDQGYYHGDEAAAGAAGYGTAEQGYGGESAPDVPPVWEQPADQAPPVPDTQSDEAAAAVAAAAATLAAGKATGRFGRQPKPPKAPKPPKQPKPPKAPKEPKPPKAPKPPKEPKVKLTKEEKRALRDERKRLRRLDWKAWFTDPSQRIRLIIWGGVVLLAVVGIMAVALGVTSSYWFCANGCHKVQDDTIIAYNRTAHSHISCMACHMPVNANAVTFMLHKVEALGELYMTITNQYSLPLNPEDEVAKTMPDETCEACHGPNRPITASAGIIIDHNAHTSRGITCTTCHNRTAHIEDFKLVNKNPDGTPSHKHPNWMTMTNCFRCHTQVPGQKGPLGFTAPGACITCHPPGFPLKPDNHKVGGDFVKTHPAVLAITGKGYCLTCHNEKEFCFKCHGVPMPHPADFKKTHGKFLANPAAGKAGFSATVCQRCHGAGTAACNNCHHNYPGFNPNIPWLIQHPQGASVLGPNACFRCHNPAFCAKCHVASGRAAPLTQ